MTAVMALMFVDTRSMSDIFEEQNSCMLKRPMATPMTMGSIVSAMTVFGVGFGVVVLAILGVIGLILQWIEPPIDLLAAFILGVSFSLAACGFMALVLSVSKNEKQAGIWSWLIIMGMCAIGGSMFPVENMPEAMQAAAKYTINLQAIDGFTELVFNGGGLADISTNIMKLLAVGVVTTASAHVLLTRRFREVSS